MSDQMHYQLEISGETATMYVGGELGNRSVSALLDVCRALPARVRTLRLDLRAVGAMSADATNAVRLLLRDWREVRHGEFRLSTSFLVATCSEVDVCAQSSQVRAHGITTSRSNGISRPLSSHSPNLSGVL
jgi:hypothetical protein